ncbi:hypothetical protein SARC_10105 [Sphaeroforma arctica JP610]|uniref:Uncharacterized protein n=1 Tax=Sphaeroforma arctica JP610 TaxID=667725 RepID=A0A0L0FKX2_9EUKA|nr:hypothetical protein SARC_10105 [Sphaeroforma arctica JP610]KNC77437.1 hypothetical protein SARC_10105 [Sphaeroforma arctica JP610]|eukprot:XP_014151339.1 hypothetical protein SARC_10105 [Sphaeroforma arctica JP610]
MDITLLTACAQAIGDVTATARVPRTQNTTLMEAYAILKVGKGSASSKPAKPVEVPEVTGDAGPSGTEPAVEAVVEAVEAVEEAVSEIGSEALISSFDRLETFLVDLG